MHSSTAVSVLAILAVASPALSAPLHIKATHKTHNVDARAVGLSVLGKELGKGLATGGGLAAVGAAAEHFLGGGSQPAQTRELSAEDIEVVKRAVGLSVLGKELGKGLATGGGLAALTAAAEHFLGGGSQPAQTREFSTEDIEVVKRAVGLSVLGKELGKGLATGGGLAALTAAAEHFLGGGSQPAQRELSEVEARSLLSSLGAAAEDTVGDVIKKGVAGGVGSAVGGAGIAGLIDHFTGGNSKREVSELEARQVIGTAAEDTFGDVIKKGVAGGVGSALGGAGIAGLIDHFTHSNGQREVSELEARQLAKLLGTAAEDTFGDVIKKGVAGGVGSAVGGAGIAGLIDHFTGKSNKREPEPLSGSALGKLALGAGTSLGVSSLVGEGIDKIEHIFKREDDLEAREPISFGTLGKGLLGTGVSLGVSSLVGDGIDKVEGLFGHSTPATRSLNDLD